MQEPIHIVYGESRKVFKRRHKSSVKESKLIQHVGKKVQMLRGFGRWGISNTVHGWYKGREAECPGTYQPVKKMTFQAVK